MKVSVVVVTYNEENNISECLDSLLNQECDDLYEILIIDGNSEDKTKDIVNNYINKEENVRLLNNPKRTVSSNRNIGIKEALNDIILFTDADCVVPKDWIHKMVMGYNQIKLIDDMVVAVGGGNIVPKDYNKFTEAIGIAFDSLLGCLGSTQGKVYSKIKEVNSLACLNILYDKEKLIQLGGFDEKLGNVGEDWDMNYRLREKGYKLYFLPNLNIYHKMRPNIKKLWKQMMGYGCGRAIIIKKSIRTLKVMYMLPIVFIIMMLISLLGFKKTEFFFPLLYFPTIIIFSFYYTLKKRKLKLFFNTVLVFLIIHFGYSIGEIKGFFKK